MKSKLRNFILEAGGQDESNKPEVTEDFETYEVKREQLQELSITHEIVFCDKRNAEVTDDCK